MANLRQDEVWLDVRAALAEVLGLDDDDIRPESALAEDLGMGAFELEQVFKRVEAKTGASVGLLDLLAHAEIGHDAVRLDGRPWVHGDAWLIAAENACSCSRAAHLHAAVSECLSSARQRLPVN